MAEGVPPQQLWALYPILTVEGRAVAWGPSSAGANRESLGARVRKDAGGVVPGLASRGLVAGVLG